MLLSCVNLSLEGMCKNAVSKFKSFICGYSAKDSIFAPHNNDTITIGIVKDEGYEKGSYLDNDVTVSCGCGTGLITLGR